MRAFVAEKGDDGVSRGLREDFELEDGDGVLVNVAWSSVNYKDALATIAKGQVARISPLVPGIDLAGTLEDGSEVLAHGYDLGVSHHGGYAEQARVPSEWLVPLPDGLSARQAMAIGTAGYTAARCVIALEEAGLTPGRRPRARHGRVRRRRLDRGRHPRRARLRGRRVLRLAMRRTCSRWARRRSSRARTRRGTPSRPMEKTRWAGAVDCVGGEVLAGVIRGLRYGAAVAACGNTGGVKLPLTVLPFILRGVSLLGVDSVQTPIEERRETWARLADDLRPPHLDDAIAREVTLDELDGVLTAILKGEVQGRTVVRVEGRMIGVGRRGCPASASFEASDELVEAQLLEPLADRLELRGAELDELAALGAQRQRLAQAGIPGIQARDDRFQPCARGFVGQGLLDSHGPAGYRRDRRLLSVVLVDTRHTNEQSS